MDTELVGTSLHNWGASPGCYTLDTPHLDNSHLWQFQCQQLRISRVRWGGGVSGGNCHSLQLYGWELSRVGKCPGGTIQGWRRRVYSQILMSYQTFETSSFKSTSEWQSQKSIFLPANYKCGGLLRALFKIHPPPFQLKFASAVPGKMTPYSLPWQLSSG